MKDIDRTKQELIEELYTLRMRIEELESLQMAHVKVEKALEESEDMFRKLAESTSVAIAIYQGDRIRYVNPSALEQIGYSEDELYNMSIWEIMHPDSIEYTRQRSDARDRGESVPLRFEFKVVTKDEQERWMDASSTTIDFQGNPAVIVTAYDITERKKVEEQLRQNEYKYRTLVERLPQKIFLKDKDSAYLSCNNNYAMDLNTTPEEIVGKTDHNFFPEQLAEKYRADDKAVMNSGETTMIEEKYIQEGEEIFVQTIKIPMTDEQGNTTGVLGIFWDITERKLAERELEEHRKRLEEMVEERASELIRINEQLQQEIAERKHIQDMLQKLNRCFLSLGPDARKNIEILVDTGGEILDGACMLYNRLDGRRNLLCTWAIWHEPEGYDPEDNPEGHICYDVITKGGDRAVVIEDLEGTHYERTDPNVIKYGLKSYLGYPIRLREKVVGSYCLCDVKKRKFSAKEIDILGMLAKAVSIEEERLSNEEDLKDFVDIASHELRHPITLVKGYAITLRDSQDKLDPDTRKELLEVINQSADRLDILTKELLDISRIERGRFSVAKRQMDLDKLIDKAVEEMKEKGAGNNFNIRFNQDITPLSVDPDKFISALVILLDNAVHYSPQDAAIDITAEPEDTHVVISVSDRGPGISEKDSKRIFERFYQAEDASHHSSTGIGMGLFIAKEIIKSHGGRIWCEPRKGGGSIFSFTIS